ncbi:FAD-dependent oxidoreductase of HI0933-like family protein [Psychromonas ingrahamii 37]|uniref:FAD-dependent oxidoreductase of HI0933-like family protein n=1 Tax=Psychromonas ingrahamii (strain DSM 17664 / CCUG 51855 / 37) TaxID=357804 RepID=A1SZ97_PSYIN|nr:NAD(P)/FAD-dependent oxidoreductase [Psychromonas ingrahamii]ABM04812.1 FAD-dependent oxidoreductase of HI0933-like family protein [Psychromonas ingrahamii 37]
MWDVIIIGAGASGLMCAIEAGKRGRKVLVLEHAKRAGQKIIMSGGGRCNFTNLYTEPANFLCDNPHFVKSALSRYTQWDFIALVDKHKISWNERDHGQLFCDDSAKQIVAMLLNEAKEAGVQVQVQCEIFSHAKLADNHFSVQTKLGDYECHSLVVATGGLSLPKMGATPLAYKIADQYEIPVKATRAGLVPFTLQPSQKEKFAELSGIGLPARATCQVTSGKKSKDISFSEALLFTHRGLSGPVILQISNYWQVGEKISLDLLPDLDLFAELLHAQKNHPDQALKTVLAQQLPKRVVECLLAFSEIESLPLKQYHEKQLQEITQLFQHWSPEINGTEGYRTAEVTLGGIDTDFVSSKTFACKSVAGLYFIGEALDVTGWLGGFNFQWAWACGWAAGQEV